LEVVEEAGVPSALDPLLEPARQGAREQVRQREQPALGAVEHVEVLDRLVYFPILEVAQPIAVLPFEEHSNERMKEVQMLRRRLQRERVDRDARLSQAQLHVAAMEQARELPVAVSEVEHDRERVVLLRERDEEVQQE